MGIAGILLGPLAALVLSVVVYEIAGSQVSAPIGLSAPLWSVAAIALALLVRSSRQSAKRSWELSQLAAKFDLEFFSKAPEDFCQFLKTFSFMENPFEATGRNLMRGNPGGRAIVALDYKYGYFYGAVSVIGEQTIAAFPNALSGHADLAIVPIGLADQFLNRVAGTPPAIRTPEAPQFERQFRVATHDAAAAVRVLNTELVNMFLHDRQLTVVVENGHLLVFRQLTYIPVKEYQDFLAKAFRLAELLGAAAGAKTQGT